MTRTALMTADEYIATPDERPRWSELIDGEVHLMNSPALRHQRIVTFFIVEIELWVRGGPGRGECPASLDCRLDERTVLAPDVLWISEARAPALTMTHLVGPPDLVVEVRFESTWARDIGVKRSAYENNGLPELWLVDTVSDLVLVHRRSTPEAPTFEAAIEVGAGAILTTPMMPGFSVDVAVLFDR